MWIKAVFAHCWIQPKIKRTRAACKSFSSYCLKKGKMFCMLWGQVSNDFHRSMYWRRLKLLQTTRFCYVFLQFSSISKMHKLTICDVHYFCQYKYSSGFVGFCYIFDSLKVCVCIMISVRLPVHSWQNL